MTRSLRQMTNSILLKEAAPFLVRASGSNDIIFLQWELVHCYRLFPTLISVIQKRDYFHMRDMIMKTQGLARPHKAFQNL